MMILQCNKSYNDAIYYTLSIHIHVHLQILYITALQEPYLKANLDIFEARGLIGKDISGNSDPFCTFYLTTNPLARYNTSYKARTLNPVSYMVLCNLECKNKFCIVFRYLLIFHLFLGMERRLCSVSNTQQFLKFSIEAIIVELKEMINL